MADNNRKNVTQDAKQKKDKAGTPAVERPQPSKRVEEQEGNTGVGNDNDVDRDDDDKITQRNPRVTEDATKDER